jgi:hypothetical protein
VYFWFVCLRTVWFEPNGLPFLIPLGFVTVIVAHMFSFLCCAVYVCLSSYCVLCMYTNIQTCLVLMTNFFCSHSPQLNMNSSHSHPFHQICISEEWIQICFCAISEFLHIFWDQQCHNMLLIMSFGHYLFNKKIKQ